MSVIKFWMILLNTMNGTDRCLLILSIAFLNLTRPDYKHFNNEAPLEGKFFIGISDAAILYMTVFSPRKPLMNYNT